MPDVLSVAALNRYVRSLLESDEALSDIAIEGEVGNFRRNAKSGHCYFTLGDAKATVRAVMFRQEAEGLAFTPEDGMKVIARGRVSLYERDGAFQLYVEFLFPSGQGAAHLAFEQLKQKLESEGLFSPELKQPLPRWPQTVGLVTSKTGAALQDILQVAQRRCPLVRFILAPVAVQGQRAPGDIVQAIEYFSAHDDVDAVIVARGGGSAEDLWVFNDEGVARAAFGCPVPLVSAIGHEVDYCILDYVADLRAPTPSAAAELVLPDMAEEQKKMMYIYSNIASNMQFSMNSWYNELNGYRRHPALASPQAALARRRVGLKGLADSIYRVSAHKRKRNEARMKSAAALAAGLNPYGVLARGYSLTQKDDVFIKSAAQLQVGDEITIRFNDGVAESRVERINPGTVGKTNGQ